MIFVHIFEPARGKQKKEVKTSVRNLAALVKCKIFGYVNFNKFSV